MQTSRRAKGQWWLSLFALAAHTVIVLAALVALVIVLLGPDEDIGAGLLLLVLIPLGAPLSILYIVMPPSVVTPDHAYAIVALGAMVNLALHARIVYRLQSGPTAAVAPVEQPSA